MAGPPLPRAALVTGAGRGLGRAHALALAASGLAVVVNDRDPGPAGETVAEIEAAGGRAIADVTDVASIAGGRAAVAVTIAAFGHIDVLVNNAGFAHGGGDVGHPVPRQIEAPFPRDLPPPLGTMAGPLRAL